MKIEQKKFNLNEKKEEKILRRWKERSIKIVETCRNIYTIIILEKKLY